MDASLARRCRSGDPEAFSELVTATGSLTYRWAYRLTGSREDALDLVQEAYTALWRALPSLREPESFRSWFLQVVGNAYRDALRRRKRLPQPVPLTETMEESPEPQPDEQVIVRDTQARVQAAVRMLPAIYAVTVTLYYLEGLGYRELAAALGVSDRTVETRLRRAREMLRHKLKAQGNQGEVNRHERSHLPGRTAESERLS